MELRLTNIQQLITCLLETTQTIVLKLIEEEKKIREKEVEAMDVRRNLVLLEYMDALVPSIHVVLK